MPWILLLVLEMPFRGQRLRASAHTIPHRQHNHQTNIPTWECSGANTKQTGLQIPSAEGPANSDTSQKMGANFLHFMIHQWVLHVAVCLTTRIVQSTTCTWSGMATIMHPSRCLYRNAKHVLSRDRHRAKHPSRTKRNRSDVEGWTS